MDDYEFNKYNSTINNFKDKLKSYGVAIIPGILNNNEIMEFRNGIWDYLEHVTANFEKPIKRNDKSTWRSLRELFPLHSMLIQHWGIGHAQFNWNIRQNNRSLARI